MLVKMLVKTKKMQESKRTRRMERTKKVRILNIMQSNHSQQKVLRVQRKEKRAQGPYKKVSLSNSIGKSKEKLAPAKAKTEEDIIKDSGLL